jgi:hypothetical protein
MRRAFVPLAALALLCGCGNPRQSPPDVLTPGPPLSAIKVVYPQAGIAFRSPGGWSTVRGGGANAVVTVSTGQAVIGIWRFPRTQPPPATPEELDAAIASLVNAAKTRDPSFTPLKTTHIEISGRPGIQVRALETVDGQQRMVRSTHIYAFGGEITVDSFCPVKDFKRVDAQVFRPLLQTLLIAAPKAAA